MVVRLQLESGEILERSETNITIGSSTSCQIVIANDRRVAPVHATLRKLGDRWLIESSEPPQVCVDDSAPAQRHWLQSEGQVIRLTLSGPQIIFQPAENGLERTGQKSSSSELRLVESNDPACDKHESETPKPSERRISPTQLNPSIGVKSSGGVQSSEMPDSPPCGVRSPFSIEQKQLAAGMLIFALLLIAFTLGSRTIDTSGSPKVQAAKTGDQKPQSVADLKQVPLQ